MPITSATRPVSMLVVKHMTSYCNIMEVQDNEAFIDVGGDKFEYLL